jgi:hypothetical protein
MRRIAALVMCGLLVFYVAWPAWSGYRISQAFETNDVALLDSKIDFERVRANLKPALAAELDKSLEQLRQNQSGFGALVATGLKGDVATRLLDTALEATVTAPALMRVVRDGRDMRDMMRGMLDKVGAVRGALSKKGGAADNPIADKGAETPAAQPSAPPRARRRLGLANIKRITPHGPLSYSLGIARDPETTEPDVTATLAFTGGDWKVVAIAPRG